VAFSRAAFDRVAVDAGAGPDTLRLTGDADSGPDAVQAAAAGAEVFLTGLATRVEVYGTESALDSMFLDTRLGADSVTVDPQVLQRIAFSFA
jgi:hypothetical protein